MARAQAIADDSRGVVEKTIMTYIPKLTRVEAAILALDTFPTSIDAVQLQRVADLMYAGHLLTRQFKVSALLAK
jgi:NitT/TauT family transport system substrate-binding protein